MKLHLQNLEMALSKLNLKLKNKFIKFGKYLK